MSAHTLPLYTDIGIFRRVEKERLIQLLEDKAFKTAANLIVKRKKLRGKALRVLLASFESAMATAKNRVMRAGYSEIEFAAALSVTYGTVARPE